MEVILESETGKSQSPDNVPKNLLEVLCPPPGEHLYAILDAARDDRILELLRNSGEHYQSLYEDRQGEDLANFAPYLVELPNGCSLLKALIKEGWGKSWGIYLTSEKPLTEVRKHFRHFLIVQTEDRKELYFRFYDPRVLCIFLLTCRPEECSKFFGPIQRMFTENEEPSKVGCIDLSAKGDPKEVLRASTSSPLQRLVIRREQMQVFTNQLAKHFVRRLVLHLRNNHSKQLEHCSEAELELLIQNGIAKADGYGLKAESSIAAFVRMMVVVSPNFDEHPTIRHILSDPETPVNAKISRLFQEVSNQEWYQAKGLRTTHGHGGH